MSSKGYKHSEEAKKKISEAMLGHESSEETRRKIGNANRGRIFTEEHRKKMSEAKKGKKLSEKHKATLSSVKKGKSPKNIKELTEKGKVYRFDKGSISWNKGKKGVMPKGKDHANWKGGVSRDKHFLSRPEYKEWRQSVMIRDEFKCRIANNDCSETLQVHHILNWVDYEELRFKISNGITLCQAHHPRGRAKEEQLIPLFRELVVEQR